MQELFTRRTRMPFSNIGRHRNRRSLHLVTKSVALIIWKLFCYSINISHNINPLPPDHKVTITFHFPLHIMSCLVFPASSPQPPVPKNRSLPAPIPQQPQFTSPQSPASSPRPTPYSEPVRESFRVRISCRQPNWSARHRLTLSPWC